MLIFADEGGGGTANPPSEAVDTSTNEQLAGESTTPEEVAQVLKSAGINVNTGTAPAATDDEEGDDPDAVVAGDASEEDAAGEGTDSEEVGNEEPVEPDTTADEATKTPQVTTDTEATADQYSFIVQDANGVTFKVTAGDDLDEVLSDFQPKSTGQLINIMRQLDRVENQQESDKTQATEDAEKAEQAQRVSDLRKGWDDEVKDLTAQKRLTDGEDGEARVREVYQFMAQENDARIKAGRPTIGSFEDALDKLEAKESREAKIEADKKDKEAARQKGSLVGGSSTPATGGQSVYRAGTARNAGEAIRAMNLL